MASFGGIFRNDAQAPNKSSYFDGNNYGYWKQMMQSYIEAINLAMWEVIQNGLAIPAQTLQASTQQER